LQVFRHDSKPQWLYGTVSHHDHNSGTMTILSDQVGKHNHSLTFFLSLHYSSKNRINHVERKRRKMGEEEEQNEKEKRRVGLKRIKAGSGSDLSDGSDSEDSSCRLQEMSCVVGSNNLPRNCCISNRPADHETAHSLPVGRTVRDLITRSSPKGKEHSPSHISELDGQRVGESPHSEVRLPSPSCNGTFQSTGVPDPQCTEGPGCDKTEEERGAGEVLEDRSEGASQEDSEAVSALLASQESEQLVSMETACVLLHTSSPECEAVEGDQENPQNDPEVRGSALNHPEAATSRSESAASLEEESRGALTQSPIMPCNAEVEAGKVAKLSQSPGASSGPELKTALVSEMTHKPTVLPSPCSSPEIISKPPVVTEASRLRLNESPEVSRIKESSSPIKVTTAKALIGLKSTPGPKVTCSTILNRSHASPPLPTDQPARSRTPSQNLSAVLDKPTKSPLIIDKNEPFTVYRDPALVRKELENHPTYIQPAHTPPTPHSNLTSTSSHAKILSPTPHLSLPSQTPLCSPHPSIPHPHLLPSLLPGLPPSTALLAGHTRLGPLGLPHHPLALQPTPSLLAQSAGTSHLAPLGLYPLLWPPFPNGAHNYGLGLQGSKWAPPESAGMYEANLRRNTPSPWLPQPTSVASAEGQGLRTPLPVRPSSADPHRVSRAVQPSTPTSKTTEELERRAFTETQRMIHTPIKIEQERVRATVERNRHNYRPVAPESPSNCPKQPQVVYDLTGDRTSHYQEESRRILQESIEVAPFTAKLGSDREAKCSKSPVIHSKQRERERERDKEQEREMHVFRHSLPPRPQSAHPSPTHTQTNYYTPVTGGVENKSSARRAPPSKELYERLSGPNTAPSVLHSPSTQSTVKARPPPLVKRHPEKEEGLLGKIAEQLACKAKSMISVEPVEHCCIERKGSSTSLISISNSSSRAVHSLHRAPIFHPPAPPVVASKEAGQGRLSPPTLTPIQPMSLSGKAQNQQRPPTLMPELRHGAVAGKRMAPEPINVTSQTYDLQRGGVLHNRERVVGGQTTNGEMITPQSATASVIVRPSSYVHAPMNYSVSERSLPQAHCEHVRTFESVPNTHLKESSSVQCKRGVLWTPVDTVHSVNMVTSKQDVNVPLNMTTKNMNSTYFNSRGVKYSANIETPYSRTEHCKKEAMVVQPNLDVSSVSCCPTRDIPHVKKRRAGLAAPEPRHNTYTVQPLHTTQTLNVNKNVLQMPHSRYSTYITHSTHTILTKGHPPALSVHTNQPAQSGQNNYHKLKKAWLTRHSEQDRGNIKPILDRNGNLEDKKPSSQNKKVCADEKKPTPITVKTEKGKGNCGDKHGDSGNESENRKSVNGGKRQPKSIHIKKQNEQQKKRGDHVKEENEEDEEEEEGKSNVNLRTTKEKSLHRLPNTNGIPRSVLKDWRKVKKLKQSGEAFLQDDSCAEIGANVQKCRECRLDRSRKAQEPAISPVFCRFYYFRRLSYSKNGVVRVDGFSVAEDTDEDAVRVWMAGFEIEDEWNKKEMELNLAKYILTLIGDKFCLLVKTENIAVTWVKKETQVMWKRAVRGVREMCDACEATLFNIHWACHKCGFVVCMDCYKARERKSAKDKELYAWVRCVKNQPHDLKNLMPTQIIPETVLTGLQSAIHTIRREYGIPSHCSLYIKFPLQTVHTSCLNFKPQTPAASLYSLSHSSRISSCRSGGRCKSGRSRFSKGVSGLLFFSRTVYGWRRHYINIALINIQFIKSLVCVLLFMLKNTQNARMPNLLDDIIASVVENKIPASKIARLGLKQDLLTEEEVELGLEEAKPEQLSLADPHASVPHDWLGSHRLLWLKDHRHLGNQRLFKENWTQEQPVLVSGLQKSLNASLWKPEHFSKEFSALHSDIYNCRDGSITNSRVKEFWDGFEDVSSESALVVIKLWCYLSYDKNIYIFFSFVRYENVMSFLPVPDYTGPDGTLNLASRLPSFFIRPDLGPRLCCAHGVTACPEQDFGTSNLHVEISDTMNILVYVGVAKGTGALSKTGVLKLLEREVLDESAKKRLKDPNETPGALWHIFLSKDLHKIQEFLQTVLHCSLILTLANRSEPKYSDSSKA
uniref:Lysine-specific demethylase 3A/B tudor domain-containing protein n=1 Tax=Astyanax mexicanus TaxID=7994 RepID=A0A8B9H1W2_ASTMX